jgi:17beta-estradiol 17-dehydrogenase / very-long-chain 3-oxoacyl-CoA reductase
VFVDASLYEKVTNSTVKLGFLYREPHHQVVVSRSLFPQHTNMIFSLSDLTFIRLFAAICVLTSFLQARKLLNFAWFHFIRPANYALYLQGPNPYALITGATDGIGKGLAKELYTKGFNLILHGRNKEKMMKVVEELKALNKMGGDIKFFFADASKQNHDFDSMVKQFEGLNITLVINNVGNAQVRPVT